MTMEISSQRLRQADTGVSAEHADAPREPDAALQASFKKAMERDSARHSAGDWPEGGERLGESAVPSPATLMESLFGGRMDRMSNGSVEQMPPGSSLPGDVNEVVDRLVERILVSEPGTGAPEVRLTLGGGVLAGAELALSRAVDGQLSVSLSCVDAASFQTAVGARDALQAALERNGENVRVEVTRGSDSRGGSEGDARRRSATYEGWSEKH